MRIRIREKEEPKLHIVIPTPLVCNRLAAWIVATALRRREQESGDTQGDAPLEEVQPDLSPEQIASLMQALRRGRKLLGKEPMVWIRSKDGDEVEIYL